MPIVLTPITAVPAGTSSKRIKISHRNGVGDYEDFDSLPVLRDPTSSYGVISSDGGIVVAADGVNNVFTRDDTGQYHFDVSNLVSGISYTAWVERVAGGITERDNITFVAGAAEAVGYYAQRTLTQAVAGTEQFDAEFRLDPFDTIADEAVVQLALNNADAFVDGVCFIEGLPALGTAPHYVATSHPAYPWLCAWASRWARADGHALRGENSDPSPIDVPGSPPGGLPNAAEGNFRRMKVEAETRIREIIEAMRGMEYNGGAGIQVGYQPYVRPSCGISGIVVG